jgi:Spy/CpxP family protein refolding chaperone
MSTESTTLPEQPRLPRPRWGRRIVIGVLLFALGGVTGFAAGLHKAPAIFWHGMYHLKSDPQDFASHVERRIDHVLSRIDANADQKAKVEAIAKSAVLDLAKLGIDPREAHEKFLTILRADTIDPEALEAARAAQIAKWDAASKRIVQALSEAAPVLTPEQRRQLTERWLARHQR